MRLIGDVGLWYVDASVLGGASGRDCRGMSGRG
jgi:hypothetical protein